MIDEKHIGSSLEDFLREEGRLEEARQVAAKRVLARQLRQFIEDQHLNTVDMAERMQTSRSQQLDRLLDPDNDKVQLDSLNRAAAIVGSRSSWSISRSETGGHGLPPSRKGWFSD
jgi:hypothetical protein